VTENIRDNLRVMIVEDYIDVAQTFEMFLQMAGFKVVIESDPLSVMKRAEDEVFDAYLIDIGLDRFSGIELARRLRKLPLAKSAFLIAITGIGKGYKSVCLSAGFDEFFTKPADISSIVDLLKNKLWI
jgi:DNA-binding response OmpR family regulator